MKILIMTLLALGIYSAEMRYKPVDKGSTITFKIKNFGFNVSGSFTGIKGIIDFDNQNVANDNIDVSIDANTVNTNNALRDDHLRGESYFDVKNYRLIHFKSTQIIASKDGYVVSGKLMIKNKVQNISFPFKVVTTGEDLLFTGSFKIKRKDYHIGGNSTISNELEVFLNVKAKKYSHEKSY